MAWIVGRARGTSENVDDLNEQWPHSCTPSHLPPTPPRPRPAVTLARLPGTSPALYRNQKMYPVTYEEPGMLLLRIDAPVFFANCVVSGRLGRVHGC